MAFIDINNDIDIKYNTELTWMGLLAMTSLVSLLIGCEKYFRYPKIKSLTKENLEIHLCQLSTIKAKKTNPSESGQSDTTQDTIKIYGTDEQCEELPITSNLLYNRKRSKCSPSIQ